MTVLGRLFGVEERSYIPPVAIPQWESNGKWTEGMVWSAYPGMTVSPDSAMRLSAVFACLRLLSEAISTLPLDTFMRRNGTRQPYRPRPAYLSFQPEQGSRIDYLSQAMLSLLVDGNAFVATPRDDLGVPTDLVVLDPTLVTIDRVDGVVRYWCGGVPMDMPNDLMHIKGMTLPGQLRGLSPIAYARETIGLGLAAQRFGQSFFENGSLPGAVIESPGTMSDGAINRFKASWNSGHQGVANANRLGVLTEGAKLSKVSVAPNDAQFLECVVPGTLFTMADGTRVPAEALEVGDEVMAWDGAKLAAACVAAVGTPPRKQIVRVRTARGRLLECSADHPILTRPAMRTPGGRAAYDEKWIPAGAVAVGNYVRVALGAVKNDAGLPFEQAYFLGAMAGNGYIRCSSCSFSTGEPAVAARMTTIARSMGGDFRPSSSRPYDWTLRTGGVGRGGSPIRSLLNRSGLVGRHSHTKFVPDLVTAGGPEAWRGFLSGLFDTDGCVRDPYGKANPCAWISSTSYELLEGTQHLLALLGIQSAIYDAQPSGSKMIVGRMCETRRSWTLNVQGLSPLRLLAIDLELSHPLRRDRLAWFLDAAPSRYRDDNFEFDRVTSVEDLGPGPTVGVEIEGLHTHVTGGLITHNTRAFQVPDVARIFGVPPHLIADASNSTSWGSGLAEQNLAFGQFSLRPWIERIEDAHGRLLTTHGLPDVFVKLNLDALLRASLKDRYESYQTGIQNQFLTRNEARKLEDMPPLPGGDVFPEPSTRWPDPNLAGVRLPASPLPTSSPSNSNGSPA